jgi:hypothetical protein
MTLGWGTVLAPLYLVVDMLGFDIRSDFRHGVYKLCVYELLKRNIIVESDGGLNMKLRLEQNRVYVGSATNTVELC